MKKTILASVYLGLAAIAVSFAIATVMLFQSKPAQADTVYTTWSCIKACHGNPQCLERCSAKPSG